MINQTTFLNILQGQKLLPKYRKTISEMSEEGGSNTQPFPKIMDITRYNLETFIALNIVQSEMPDETVIFDYVLDHVNEYGIANDADYINFIIIDEALIIAMKIANEATLLHPSI